MKLRYRIILLFVIIILMSSLPLSMFILERFEGTLLQNTDRQNSALTQAIARSSLHVLLMNGGNIDGARVDIGELIRITESLKADGLVYSEVFLLSSNPALRGRVLAQQSFGSISSKKLFKRESAGKVLESTVQHITANPSGVEKRICNGKTYLCYYSSAGLPGRAPYCGVRLVYSRDLLLSELLSMRRITYVAILVVLMAALVFAYFFSRSISLPIDILSRGVIGFREGAFATRIDVQRKDEIGVLSQAFNEMAASLEQKIAELEGKNRQLQKLDLIKDQVMAHTSHELRTPLHGMMGLAESILKGQNELTPAVKDSLDLILSSGQRLTRLIQGILELSQLRGGDLTLNFRRIPLSIMADTIISLLQGTPWAANLEIHNEVPSDLPAVKADPDRLEQILINLVGNAIRYTDQGEVVISAEEKDNLVMVTIADTGRGINPEKIERIFESMEWDSTAAPRKEQGAGFGLPITKNLIEQHGGNISITSVLEEGTIVSFSLQKADETVTAWDQRETTDAGNYSFSQDELSSDVGLLKNVHEHAGLNGTILLVDDEPVNLQIMINNLVDNDYNVIIAENGYEAMEQIEFGDPLDLVLLDIMMPGINGFDVCEWIRERYQSHELPVIMLSARGAVEDITRGLDTGANDYLMKPFERDELLMRVRNQVLLKRNVARQHDLTIIEQELDTARTIQRSILPDSPPVIEGVDISIWYQPASRVGGDFYDFYRFEDGSLGVFMADVAGHGLSAALVASMVKVMFINTVEKFGTEPARFMDSLQQVFRKLAPGSYMTSLYTYIDFSSSTVTTANAGHWPMLAMNDGSLFQDATRGVMLGFPVEHEYRETSFSLREGTRLVIYTDGILEEPDTEGTLFGDERFRKLVEASLYTEKPLTETVGNELNNWSGNYGGFEDDMTLVVIDYFGESSRSMLKRTGS